MGSATSLHTWVRTSNPPFLTAYMNPAFLTAYMNPAFFNAYMGTHLQLSNFSLLVLACCTWHTLMVASLKSEGRSARWASAFVQLSIPMSAVIATWLAISLCRCPLYHLSMPVSAVGLALYLGPAAQHAVVLSVSVYVTLQMGTPMTASSICLITSSAKFPPSD